jgi:hypothetical protein
MKEEILLHVSAVIYSNFQVITVYTKRYITTALAHSYL